MHFMDLYYALQVFNHESSLMECYYVVVADSHTIVSQSVLELGSIFIRPSKVGHDMITQNELTKNYKLMVDPYCAGVTIG